MQLTSNPVAVLFWIALAFTILLIIYPISFLLYGSIWSARPGSAGGFTLAHYARAFTDPNTIVLLVNSFVYALGSALLAVSVSSILAFITARTDAPFRKVFRFVPVLPLILPGFVDNLAWIYLFSPNAGLVNVWFKDSLGVSFPLFNIYSMVGMIWVMGISLVPTTYLVIYSAFTTMDSSLEEAARIAGAKLTAVVRHVTIPIMRPAIISVFLLVFIIAFESFETPAMVGLPARIEVFMSQIYQSIAWNIPPNYGLGTAYASILLVVTVGTVYLYRRATRRAERFRVITGKGYRSHIIHLGRWKYFATSILVVYLIIHVFLVFSTVFLLSVQPFWNPRDLISKLTFQNYYLVLERSRIVNSLFNSVIVSSAAASIVIVMATLVAYISKKSRFKWRAAIEGIGTLPIAFPGFVIGLGFLWMFLTLPLGVYGTIQVIVLAFLVKYLPHGIRFTTGAITQVHTDLEESSAIAGADWIATVKNITIPLLRPAMLAGWVYIFIISFKELSSVIFLITPRNEVLAAALWDLWVNGSVELLSAASILLAILLWSIVAVTMGIFKLRIR
ncbi:MAG: iron ABC transporter permease [Thaumarchaeota archaeon]|nr:iron ABC transporter permease [Nitrososphaerota archaeon]